MMKWKKILSVLLVVGMLAGLLAGCGNGAKKTADGEGITIDWYLPDWVGTGLADLDMVVKAMNEIIYEETGAYLQIHVPNGNYTEQMNVKVQSGEEIDIMWSQAWDNEFLNHATNGAFYDVSDLVETYAPDILEKSEDYMIAAGTVNGALYGFPAQAAYANIRAAAFRKDLVEKYNFDISTVDEVWDLEPYFEVIAENEPGVTPFLGTLTVADASNCYTDVPMYGVGYDDATGEFVSAFTGMDYLVEKHRAFWEWYQKGWTNQGVLTDDWDTEAKSGKYAVLEAVSGNYDETGVRSSTTYGYECVEADMGITTITNNNVLGGITCIGATCENPEKALEILNLIWKDPVLSNMMAYGLEGVHYTVDKEKSTDDETFINIVDGVGYGLNFYQIGPYWDSYSTGTVTRESLLKIQQVNADAWAQMSDNAKALIGFYPDLSDFDAEVAAIGTIRSEAYDILMTGTAPDYDKYVSELDARYKEAGMEEVIAEITRQFEERLAAQ